MEEEIRKQFVEFQGVHEELDKDFVTCILNTRSGGSQLWKRAAVRCLFAHVEAVAFRLKRLACLGHRMLGVDLTSEELAAIEGIGFLVDDTGEVKRRPQWIPALPNLRFAFKVFSKVYKLDWSPDFGGEGWQNFQQALKVRDRITHPRTQADITITVDDFEAIKTAQGWWRNTLNALFFKYNHKLSATLRHRA